VGWTPFVTVALNLNNTASQRISRHTWVIKHQWYDESVAVMQPCVPDLYNTNTRGKRLAQDGARVRACDAPRNDLNISAALIMHFCLRDGHERILLFYYAISVSHIDQSRVQKPRSCCLLLGISALFFCEPAISPPFESIFNHG